MLRDWQQMFPASEPLAHELKTKFHYRWVRFHSLPGSKRYPESEAEYATILARHNHVMAKLTRAGSPVVLLSTGYSSSPEPVREDSPWAKLDPNGEPWRTVLYNAEVPIYWHIFASEWTWKPAAFDQIVRLVADEVVADVSIVAPDCQWLLHPYDGGMDLILDTCTRRDQLKSQFSDWLSARPDGL